MAHDIRSPLAAMRSLVALIEQDGLTDRQGERMTLLKRSIESLYAITSTLMGGEADDSIADEAPQDLQDLMQDVCALYRLSAEEKGLAFSLGDMRVNCQLKPEAAVAVRRAVSALVDNAVKYTNSGSVKVAVLEDVASEGAHKLLIRVRDTGCGVLPQDADKIFEQRVRGENAASDQPGEGLGLWSASSLVGDLGGKIHLITGEEVGACFELHLPMDRISMPSEREEEILLADEAYVQDRQFHVLVIDDNEVNRLILSAMLESFSVSCDLAANGEAGLALASLRQHDAIFLDLRMPGMDGEETAQRLSQLPDWRGTPIIAVSASENVDAASLRPLGISKVLTKPISPDELFQLVMQLRQERKTAVAVA